MRLPVDINFLPLKNRRKRILHILSILFVLGSVVLLAYPFMGSFEYYAQTLYAKDTQNTNSNSASDTLPRYVQSITNAYEKIRQYQEQKSEVIQSQMDKSAQSTKGAVKSTVPKDKQNKNVLIIPKIGVEMDIVEGENEKALYKGAWRIPGTSMPNLGGNTVLGGHRYLYRPPSKRTFYNLDKLAVGDAIQVFWQGEEYNYKVKEIKIVDPKQIEILNNTKEDILTLFTCTPLFTSKKRLVVIAEKI